MGGESTQGVALTDSVGQPGIQEQKRPQPGDGLVWLSLKTIAIRQLQRTLNPLRRGEVGLRAFQLSQGNLFYLAPEMVGPPARATLFRAPGQVTQGGDPAGWGKSSNPPVHSRFQICLSGVIVPQGQVTLADLQVQFPQPPEGLVGFPQLGDAVLQKCAVTEPDLDDLLGSAQADVDGQGFLPAGQAVGIIHRCQSRLGEPIRLPQFGRSVFPLARTRRCRG